MAYILQLSDPHLFDDDALQMYGCYTNQRLAFLIQCLKQYFMQHQIKLAAIVVTGDLVQQGGEKALQFLQQQCAHLGDAPQYWLAGNHDDLQILKQYTLLPTTITKPVIAPFSTKVNNWRIIGLNTLKVGSSSGYYDDQNQAFLKKTLVNCPQNSSALVALHHPPRHVGSAWIDALNLQNATDFWSDLQSYPQVKLVLHGHTHQFHQKMINTVMVASCPSSAVQFVPQNPIFELDTSWVGAQLIKLGSPMSGDFALTRLQFPYTANNA